MLRNILVGVAAAVFGACLLALVSGCGQPSTTVLESEYTAEVDDMPQATPLPIPQEPVPAYDGALLDLVAAGKIEASVAGSGIQYVTLTLRNLTAERIRVHIPPGTFFASNSDSAQSMVATAQQETYLEPNQETGISVSTACANLPLHIPDSENTFTIAATPPHAELAQLAPLLANESYAVQQAAVWIITDDANFDGLGILVQGSSRVIGWDDAARAMQILDLAGVDLSGRSIWSDRVMLADFVQDADLKAWLLRRAP